MGSLNKLIMNRTLPTFNTKLKDAQEYHVVFLVSCVVQWMGCGLSGDSGAPVRRHMTQLIASAARK